MNRRLLKALKVVAEGPKVRNFHIDRVAVVARPEVADIKITVTIDYEGLKKLYTEMAEKYADDDDEKYDPQKDINDLDNWIDGLGPEDFYYSKNTGEIEPPEYGKTESPFIVWDISVGDWEYSGGEVSPIDEEEWDYGKIKG